MFNQTVHVNLSNYHKRINILLTFTIQNPAIPIPYRVSHPPHRYLTQPHYLEPKQGKQIIDLRKADNPSKRLSIQAFVRPSVCPPKRPSAQAFTREFAHPN